MLLKNKYVFGLLIQWYEIEMLDEHLESLKQMIEDVENSENLYFDFHITLEEVFEKVDWIKFKKTYDFSKYEESVSKLTSNPSWKDKLTIFNIIQDKIHSKLTKGNISVGHLSLSEDESFYNIADYRRDISWKYCTDHDFICWSETDSLWPKQTLEVMEGLVEFVGETVPKFVVNFAGRKNWDSSWDQIVHPLYEKVQYQDNDEWIFNNEASEKSYMTLERMNKINDIDMSKVEVRTLTEPKADGSCLIFSSELLKSGVTLPKSLIHHGEDESMLRVAKRIMGDQFVQFHVHNLLRVHNRRHPKKRMFILNEDNPTGICTDEKKGNWWGMLEEKSKFNLETLFQQQKSKRLEN